MEKEKDIKKRLTCTKCGDVKEQFSALVYSQGDLVCEDCNFTINFIFSHKCES